MLTAKQKQELSDYALGTCKSDADLASTFKCTEDGALEAIVEIGEIELCATCSWWCELHELDIVDDEHVCSDCREVDE